MSDEPSDYAATRDFTDWLWSQRDPLERMAASKALVRHPSGAEYQLDPCEALWFMNALCRRAQTLRDHFAKQVARKRDAAIDAHVKANAEMNRLLNWEQS